MVSISLDAIKKDLREISWCESGGSTLRVLLWLLIMKDNSQAMRFSSIFFKIYSKCMPRMMSIGTPERTRKVLVRCTCVVEDETFCCLMDPCNLNVLIETFSIKAWRSTSMVDIST